MKQLFLHGGPLESGTFSGKTFWVHKDQAFRALEYADEGELWGVLIDPTEESFVDEDEDEFADSESAWDEQTRQIEAAFASGATVFASDDGWAIDHRSRRIRRILIK